MEYYSLTTDKDIWEHLGDGEYRIAIYSKVHEVFLLHEHVYSKEEFENHVKEAYKNAMKKSPNSVKAAMRLEEAELSMEDVTNSMCELFGYSFLKPRHSYHLEKTIIQKNGEDEKAVIKNILDKDLPPLKKKEDHSWVKNFKNNVQLDDIPWDDYFEDQKTSN